MAAQCKYCGSSDIEFEPARGQSVCMDCGVVLAENHIVSEVQFAENSQGQSSAVGQFVSHEMLSARPMLLDAQGSFGRSSREITYASGKKQINGLCSQLGTRSLVNDAAFNYFRMSVFKGITKGRKRIHVIAACVYMACRAHEVGLMLIDVSDAVETDAFEVGRTFLRLTNALCIKLPALDPCLYIIRFSYRLQFGDQTKEVSETALRLVQRMKKDWMHTGRRPSGVCGAALVIAARFHNFNRTIQDVIKVVKVHESTVRKRLTEFGSTPSSEMTPEEFMKSDLNQSEDPPAFKAARRKEEEEKLQKLMEKEENLSNQFTDLQKEIEKCLRERKNKIRGKYASEASSTCSSPLPEGTSGQGGDKDSTDAVQFIAEVTMESIQECLAGGEEQGSAAADNSREILPSTASMGLKQSIEESMQVYPSEPQPEESGVLDLEGIDDDEIDSYILSNREQESKTNYWMNLNQAYLDEVEKKKEQERLDEEQRIKEGLPPKKKRVTTKRKKGDQPANSAGEAIGRVIKEKKLSSKIDYSILENLNSATDDISETHSIVTKSSISSRSSRKSNKTASKPIPSSLFEIMQSINKAPTPAEAMPEELETECESVPLFKKPRQELAEAPPLDEDEEDDDEASDDEDQDMAVNRDNLLFRNNDDYDEEFEDY